MARRETKSEPVPATGVTPGKANLDDDDDFDGNDADEGPELQEGLSQTEKVQTRRRLEDYFEEKRLREQLGDDLF